MGRYLKGIEKLPPAYSKYCRMTWSRSLACGLRLAAMNLNALRRQYLVIYSFVFRRRLNFPTRILNARRSEEFPCDIFLPYSSRVSSLRCEWSTKNWIMVLDELQITWFLSQRRASFWQEIGERVPPLSLRARASMRHARWQPRDYWLVRPPPKTPLPLRPTSPTHPFPPFLQLPLSPPLLFPLLQQWFLGAIRGRSGWGLRGRWILCGRDWGRDSGRDWYRGDRAGMAKGRGSRRQGGINS